MGPHRPKAAQDNTEGLLEAAEGWLRVLASAGASPHTLRGYRGDAAAFFRWFRSAAGEEPDPARITSADIRTWQRELLERGLRPAAVRRKMAALRAFFRWAEREGLCPRIPSFPRAPAEAPRAPLAPDRAALNRLLREAERSGPRDLALVRLMLSCGLRISEAASLRVSDLQLGERSGRARVRGKGGKLREVPIPSEARRALREWLARHPGGEWLFPGRGGGHLSPSAAWRAIKALAWRARIPSLRPHQLRHACAYHMLRAGADLVLVGAMLGHARLDTTARYVLPRMEDLERAAEGGEV